MSRAHSIGGKGIHNAICQVCRAEFKNTELRLRWDGLRVCDADWEPRNVLDFYRNKSDASKLDFVLAPDTELDGMDVKATLSADVSSPTTDAWTLLALDTEVKDVNTEFTPGTSTYRPDASGTYEIRASMKVTLGGAPVWNTVGLAIYKNGAALKVFETKTAPSGADVYIQGRYSAALLSTDDITLRYYVTGSGTVIDSESTATYMGVIS